MAAERERARWARELHDTVLQGMGARRLLFTSVLKSGDPEELKNAVEEGLRDVGRDIDDLASGSSSPAASCRSNRRPAPAPR